MRTALVSLALIAAAAAPSWAATPKPTPAAEPAEAKLTVVDEVVMVGAAPAVLDGQRILGRVKEIDKKEKKLWVIVNWGQNEGPVSIPLDRVRRVDYDVAGRRAELPAGDSLARYKLALWLISVGLKDEALIDLEAVAGKPGVPAEAWKLLAALQEARKLYRQALASIEQYLKSNPDDVEAQAALKRLAELVGKLPREPEPVKPVQEPDPAKPPEPEKPKVLEGLELREGWRAQPWGNPADVSRLKDDASGNEYLAVQMSGDGKEDKTAVGLRVNGDITKRAKLVFNVYNPDGKPLKLSVAFNTSADFFETMDIWAKKGWNEAVAVDLNASDFKCRANGWAHNSPLKGKDQLNNIMILVNEKRKVTIYLDYVHFE